MADINESQQSEVVRIADSNESEIVDIGTKFNGTTSALEVLSEVTNGQDNPAILDFKTAAKDAFGRLRSSTPTVIFETNFIENDRSDLYDSQTLSGATLVRDTQKNHMELRTSTTNGSSVLMQSRQRVKYTVGQSNLNIFVGIFELKNNLTQSIGLCDGSDGFIFEVIDGGFGVSILSSYSGSVVKNRVEQSNFNIDRMDGSGPSGITIDFEKPQIYLFDYQWLGVGTVRWAVFIDGKIIPFHQTNHANVITESKYMRAATLPVRAESTNTGITSGNSVFVFSCASVLSEGETERAAIQRSQARLTQRSLVTNEFRPVVSIRLKPSSDYANIRPVSFKIQGTTNDQLLVELRVNSTISNGTNWQDVSGNSVAQFDVGSNDIADDGECIETLFTTDSGFSQIQIDNTLQKIGKNIDGSSNVVSLAVRSLTNNADCYGSITWLEVY